MLTGYFDAYARAYQPYKGGPWCYEDGCVYQGLRLLHEATGDRRWFDHLRRLVDARLDADGHPVGYDPAEYNIDNVLPGRALIALHAATGEPRYLAGARLIGQQLAGHPRTADGNFWHKRIYPDQVWLDGLYMGLPFAIELGQATGDGALVDDALRQIARALELTDSGDGLYAHGYDAARRQAWADPITGRSPAHWARALGWLVMALVDIVELIGKARMEAAGLTGRTTALLAEIVRLQRPSGLWLQVIDLTDLPGNYEESSATAMFAYALQKAARLGLGDHREAGSAALDALLRSRVVGEPARFEGICLMAGLGGFGSSARDGTPAYYLSEPVVADDPKGVGPLMMAAAEARRATASSGTTLPA
ncbi:MAG: unsaturated rhamnogalacturonyl hydrolase [Proteobacteria bacterium]|nr:unsaturated rhamnogalacturonyl hydrolase [Pseudomonadota bacterium]